MRIMIRRTSAAALLAGGATAAVVAGLILAPVSPAGAAAPTNCTATGGTITTIKDSNGIFYNVHTFTASGTFTPPQTVPATYLVVAGGGGGGPVSNRRMAGGGGGGGNVVTGSADLLGSAHTITVGDGGTAGTGTTQG
ncbi:MAG: hypothetical protein Q8K58_13335, partial [Acidimicrobiales bacterium]|nr:hypothetical protein [Acidimicrobiales bacterium]